MVAKTYQWRRDGDVSAMPSSLAPPSLPDKMGRLYRRIGVGVHRLDGGIAKSWIFQVEQTMPAAWRRAWSEPMAAPISKILFPKAV